MENKEITAEEIRNRLKDLGFRVNNFDDLNHVAEMHLPSSASTEQICTAFEKYYFSVGRHRMAADMWEHVGNYKKAKEIFEKILIPRDHYPQDTKKFEELKAKQK